MNEQIQKSLNRANETRSKRYELKVDIKEGKTNVVKILSDPPEYIKSMQIDKLLMMTPGVGEYAVTKILHHTWISPNKLIRNLTAKQINYLQERCKSLIKEE